MQFCPSYHLVGASPLPLDVKYLFLVGSNIFLSMVVQQWGASLEFSQEKMSTHPFTPPSWILNVPPQAPRLLAPCGVWLGVSSKQCFLWDLRVQGAHHDTMEPPWACRFLHWARSQYAPGEEQRNSSGKNEEAEPKWKQHPVVGVTGNGSKVWCCKEQYCIGTWDVSSMNQGKLEVVKQEMARVNIDILGICELKWTRMEDFNSDDHYIYCCGQESLIRNGVALIVNKNLKCSTWVQS